METDPVGLLKFSLSAYLAYVSCSKWFLSAHQNFQVEAPSVSGGQTISKAASAENLNPKSDESSTGDSNEKEMSLGDALTQAKDASPTSLEEIQNLAGGADIKVNQLCSYVWNPSMPVLWQYCMSCIGLRSSTG